MRHVLARAPDVGGGDLGPTSPALCRNCQVTPCGSCFGMLGGDTLCRGLDVADTQACNALITCTTNGMAVCASTTAAGCYCSGPPRTPYTTCASGGDGPCAAQFQALAHSDDPAVVMQQIGDPSTTIGKIAKVLQQFAIAPCGPTCFIYNN